MDDLTVRKLEKGDLWNGFLQTLDALSPASNVTESEAEGIFERIKSQPGQVVLVAEQGGKIVGTVTLLIEPKFIHKGGFAGHIEDFAVAEGLQGKGVGTALMKQAIEVAKESGCYKTTLICPDRVKPVHKRLGFRVAEDSMRLDHA